MAISGVPVHRCQLCGKRMFLEEVMDVVHNITNSIAVKERMDTELHRDYQ